MPNHFYSEEVFQENEDQLYNEVDDHESDHEPAITENNSRVANIVSEENQVEG